MDEGDHEYVGRRLSTAIRRRCDISSRISPKANDAVLIIYFNAERIKCDVKLVNLTKRRKMLFSEEKNVYKSRGDPQQIL